MTAELPPPSGPPQPSPEPLELPETTAGPAPRPVEPPAPVQPPPPPPPPPPPAPPVGFAVPAPLEVPGPSQLGTNGLAVAALVCGVLGFFTPAAVVAVVLGIVSLRQMKARFQTGRGLAIGGIVVAVVWIGLLGPAFVTGFKDGIDGVGTPRDAGGTVTAASRVTAFDLAVGDCLDLPDETETEVEEVTIRPCTQAHEGEVAVEAELPPGPYPGDEEASAQAEEVCSDRVGAVLSDDALDDVDLFLLYPNTVMSWEVDRSVTCVLVPVTGGTTTGSFLSTSPS